MSNVTSTFRSKAQIEAASTGTIYNVIVALANTEVSQPLSTGTKQFTIRVRGLAKLQFSFDPGQSGTTYFTVPPGTNYTADALNFSGTIYFQTNKATQVVEIIEWS